MANLLEVIGAVIPVGTIIDSVGPPDSRWLKCDGSVLLQASYPAYVAFASDLHPMMWTEWTPIDINQSVDQTVKYDIDYISSQVVAVGSGSTSWYSSDGGATWNTATNLSTGTHYFLINNGTNFITARYGSTEGYYSTTGNSWSSATLPSSQNWRYGSYANGVACIFSSATVTAYATSSDGGVNWTGRTAPWTGDTVMFAATDGSTHYVFTEDGTYSDTYTLHTSTDGINWTSGTERFMQSSPHWNVLFPIGLFYCNSEYYILMSDTTGFFCMKYEGTSIVDPNHWVSYLIQQNELSYEFFADEIVYANNKFVLVNSGSYSSTMLVGTSMHGLNPFGIPFGGSRGVITDGSNWMISLPYVSGYNTICRSIGVSYNTSTHFQLPLASINSIEGVTKYIKVLE